MRISYLTGQLGLGGAEKQLFLLVKGLLKKGYEISVFDFYPQQNGYWRGPLQDIGVDLISYPSQSKTDRIYKLVSDLKRIKPKVVHGWNFHTNPYANYCGRIANIPVRIGSVREHPNYWPSSNIAKFTSFYGLDGVVFNSKTAYLYYKHQMHWPMKSLLPKEYVINNGIDIQEFKDKGNLLNELNAEGISLPSDRNVLRIIGIGRLNVNKNWTILIKACKYLFDQKINFVTIIFGEGPEKNNLFSQIKEFNLQDNIILAGSIPNASKFLPLFDLLCSCSLSEGLSNTIMEASFNSLPVLATKVGGTEEIISDNETGILVEANDVKNFQQNLLYLGMQKEVRYRMGIAGKARMEKLFSYQSMVKKMIEMYNEQFEKVR